MTAGTASSATSASSTTPARSKSTRRSGGASGRTSRAMPRARRSRRSMPSRSRRGSRLAEEEQKLVEELQSELAKLKVSDLLLQTLYTVSSLGYHRVSGETKDLGQAKLAIDSLT